MLFPLFFKGGPMNKKLVLIAGGFLLLFFLAACGTSNTAGRQTPVMKPVAKHAEKIIPETEVTLIAVGDINLARKVDRLMSAYGMDYPLKEVKERLVQADFTFGNLECAVSDRGTPLDGKGIWLRARPEVFPELKECGFDLLSVANNHSLDYDSEAFLDTLNYSDQAGILSVGGGKDIVEARTARVVKLDDLSIGFLAYTQMADIIWSNRYPRKLKATETLPGAAPFEYETIIQDVKNLSEEVDIVVLSLHWGAEYSRTPSPEQRQQAHDFIDSGADVILGHHPHVTQGVEYYNKGLIAYSLGNFVFDQNWSDETREGLVMELKLKRSGVTAAKILPVIIRESQPRLEQTEWAKHVAGDVLTFSAELETECEVREEPLEVVVKSLQYPER